MVEFMKKILVAEDDKGLSYSIDTWLTLEGFEVVTVYNGEEAFNALKNHPYDLLITDIAMPRLNGYELIKKVRGEMPELPVLVVSGKLDPELVGSLEALSIRHFLHKPIKLPQFRKMLERLFPGSVLS
ncbi:MAG: response regulator [Calditrichia bacterium]|nr:response regulator [Calditrichota bacterium]MCB0267303.1 response regulator [Calditrichota bacterium]MCB0285500.1 response regulator [Calditrichota bacterium]MCB9068627.1 response regulator [Calditrichia bacterium]